MIYNIHSFVFIYVMVVIYSTYTFAPWINKPEAPEDGKMGTCYDWLIHHEFTDNPVENRIKSSTRASEYDQDVSYFAAAFAYLLTNMSDLYDIIYFGPKQFCELHSINHVKYPYITLKDAEFTCEGWIDLYIYPVNRDSSKKLGYNIDYDPKYNNFIWAQNRDSSMDSIIPLWAALYFKYITCDASNAYKTPKKFCSAMRKPVMNVPLPRKYPFMTFDGSKMSCSNWNEVRQLSILKENLNAEENAKDVTKFPYTNIVTECYDWIIHCGFSDINSTNYQKIFSESVDENSVNPFAKKYIIYVKQWQKNHEDLRKLYDTLLQKELLKITYEEEHFNYINHLLHQVDIRTPGNIVDIFMTPKEFCEGFYLSDIELLNYFAKIN